MSAEVYRCTKKVERNSKKDELREKKVEINPIFSANFFVPFQQKWNKTVSLITI
jgi:hypothetical protein